jgi:hypothetical protein
MKAPSLGEFQRLTGGYLLFLPLCPSTNARMQPVRMGHRCQDILTKEARNYILAMSMALKLWANKVGFAPIDDYVWIDLWFILPRTNCDAHNYGKVLFDALEDGGIVTNDKFILPRVMGIWHDAQAEVVIKLPDRLPVLSGERL